MKNNYYIGLDLGTNSLGWAVTDERYNVLKFRGKSMIGTHLFQEGETAETRRGFRSARRRLQRRNNRIRILKEIFSTEISKVDPGFYQRLEDSFFWEDDKEVQQSNSLFNDENYKDKDFHNQYPTIYHLRSALIHKDEKFDVRLIYLAIHHILKKRGHFLFTGKNINVGSNLKTLFEEFNLFLSELTSIESDIETLSEEDIDPLISILENQDSTLNDKNKKIRELLKIKTSDSLANVLKIIAGSKVDLKNIFPELEENLKIELKTDLDVFKSDNQELLTDDIVEFLDQAKLIYDTVLLADILQDNTYISDSKVESYDEHGKELKMLKKVFKKYLKDDYDDFFRTNGENYSAYVDNNKNLNEFKNKKITQEDINKAIEKYLQKITTADEDVEYLREKASLRQLLPKQKVGENSTIPNQLHRLELVKILENQKKYHPFLEEIDQSGFSNIDKIIKTFDFRIPYYVGPLNDEHKVKEGGFAWIKKKSEEDIKPWNFEEIVDLEESAERFIRNMTNTCTYLVGEDVLPKDSLLYQEFEVLNEINNIKINGHNLDTEYKNYIYEEFFVKRYIPRFTKKDLIDNLQSIGALQDDDNLEGIDININASLKTYHNFKKIIGDKVNNKEMVEDIVKWGTLYNDAKDMLNKKIKREYGDILTNKEINRIVNINYRDWGRLSKKLLTGLIPDEDKNKELMDISIIDAMRENSLNLMELLSDKYGYKKLIEEENQKVLQDQSIEEMIDDSYASPAVKRTMYRTIDIVKEIEKIMGNPPNRIFVEMARSSENTGRTTSRKSRLLELYKSIKDEDRDWVKEIEGLEESQLRSKTLFLYYTQMGKCMYTGKEIKINRLFDRNIYDIDHIYPRSKTKDDSILNNLVLVHRHANDKKGDIYPLNRVDESWQGKMYHHWKFLYDKGFITKEKFNRLVRTKDFEADELSGFIARQLVETRQSTKEVARILSEYFKDSKIIFSKAGNVSDFRHKFDLLKVRELNDFHHAEDAYLNIVVGNSYYTKFTSNPYNFIKKTGGPRARNYNLYRLFDDKIERNNYVAWDNDVDLKTVKKEMENPWKQFTRYAFTRSGELFNQQAGSKEEAAKGIGYVPIKAGDKRFHKLERYGGFTSVKNSYYCLIEHLKRNKMVRSIEVIPIYIAEKIDSIKDLENYFIEQFNYDQPRILIKRIKNGAKFRINGFYYHLLSRFDESRYRFVPAVQLNLSEEFKLIIRESNKLINNKSYNEKILNEENLNKFYDCIIEKLEKTIYKNIEGTIIKVVIEGKEKFRSKNMQEKSKILMNIILCLSTSSKPQDLSLIGGSKTKGGEIRLNKQVTKFNEFKLINESPTGLYVNEVDLLGEF